MDCHIVEMKLIVQPNMEQVVETGRALTIQQIQAILLLVQELHIMHIVIILVH